MLKVFLAEDEFVVREGIKNNIDWIGHGYEFCGEASDGELAFPLIQKLQQFRDDASVRILGSTSFHASCSRYGRLMLPPAESRQTSVVAWQAFRSSRICSERSGRLG